MSFAHCNSSPVTFIWDYEFCTVSQNYGGTAIHIIKQGHDDNFLIN
jgi:hypothetical protein